MITVHHLNNSRSQRVIWMLEELGLPYEIRRYERNARTMLAPPELRRVHPLGKSPVIEHEGRTLIESAAICEYLVDLAGGRMGAPTGLEDKLRYRQFLHYAEASMMVPLLLKLIIGRIPIMGKMAAKKIQPMITLHLDFVESELVARPWFAGDELTAADVMMSFPLEAARVLAGLDAQSHPHISQWLDTLHDRPAYQRALEAGGTYDYA
ncbi:glutathione S-transferase family protein [Novosphingobium sp. MBES04]|uniref:glutathione S-transferase family protein n=1 Tax=Novosphingobium sp. MBES04 TaxID=1206458 RepID=UPI00057D3288|nr:glutathione S-transferase [Novosphingobium sp. MBES04]GAM03114.1 glutathione S-transferase [Novosphingobium sp. MBES04]